MRDILVRGWRRLSYSPTWLAPALVDSQHKERTTVFIDVCVFVCDPILNRAARVARADRIPAALKSGAYARPISGLLRSLCRCAVDLIVHTDYPVEGWRPNVVLITSALDERQASRANDRRERM
jgi:hypothetical protein